MTRPSRRLLLIGGGHAHVEVVRRLAEHREVKATLINPGRYASYSGMLTGLIAGLYGFHDTHIDLQQLCDRSGVELVLGCVSGIHPNEDVVDCEDGTARPYDVVSIDTGSVPQFANMPGAAEHAVPVKPVAQFLVTWERWLASQVTKTGPRARVVVVGGGAGGVELILAMRQRLMGNEAAGPEMAAPEFTLISESLLPGHARRVQGEVRAILRRRGIQLEQETVTQLSEGRVHTRSGRTIPGNFVVFATRASAPRWIAQCGLAVDSRGFVAVDEHLRSLSHENVFAAGDVATNPQRPAPKSGVYAVRAGPILAKNLLAVLSARPPTAVFSPQRRALSLIGSGDRHATLSYGPFGFSGCWVWRWKDRIDRRFVERYANR